MRNIWNDETTVIYALPNSDANLVRYFNPSTTWLEMNDISPAKMQGILNEHGPGGVWLETTAIKNMATRSNGEEWLTEHAIENIALDNGNYYLRFTRVK